MTALNKQALLGADKHANQHRLSRLIIEANSAELRAIAEAVEQYTDQLIAALADSEKRIAELEARTVTLPPLAPENLASVLDGYEKWLIATTFRDKWNACLSEVVRMNAADIKVKES
ncbi:hypothetical protein ACXZ2Y_001115 [Salmonella enterica subsp. enterica serovar Newport]